MPNETIGKTLGVAAGVCVVCSVFVSSAAVFLKPIQEANKALEKKTYILLAADLLKEGGRGDVDELFKQIETVVIDVDTGARKGSESWDPSAGKWVEAGTAPKSLDVRKAARDPEKSRKIPPEKDLAGLKRKANSQLVYFIRKDDAIHRIILPVHGKGLWSTMYGFLALDRDLTTIKSFAFYEHGETPGLGGEVDNPRWKASWVGKKAFDGAWELKIAVVKGSAGPDAVHEVDGLSGATLTARGVDHLVRFWLGEEGYGPLLARLREGGERG